MMKMMSTGLKFGRTWVDRIMGKVDKDQGVANAGKYLGVGEDGNVTLKEIVIPEGKTYAIKVTYSSNYSSISRPGTTTMVDDVEGYLFSTNVKKDSIVNAELDYISLNGSNYYASKLKQSGSTGTTLSDLGIYYFTESIGNTIRVAIWIPTSVLGEATNIYAMVNYISCNLEVA